MSGGPDDEMVRDSVAAAGERTPLEATGLAWIEDQPDEQGRLKAEGDLLTNADKPDEQDEEASDGGDG